MVDSYGLRLRLPLEGLEDKADGVLVYFLSDTDHQLGKKKKLRLNIPPGKYCICACKFKLSFCFSTSAEEYEANNLPQYFLYELQPVHQSSMIPMYYMWAPITCISFV